MSVDRLFPFFRALSFLLLWTVLLLEPSSPGCCIFFLRFSNGFIKRTGYRTQRWPPIQTNESCSPSAYTEKVFWLLASFPGYAACQYMVWVPRRYESCMREEVRHWTASYSYTTWTNQMWLLNANVKRCWYFFYHSPLCVYVRMTSWISRNSMFCCKLDVNCWWVVSLPVTLAEVVLAANVILASFLGAS